MLLASKQVCNGPVCKGCQVSSQVNPSCKAHRCKAHPRKASLPCHRRLPARAAPSRAGTSGVRGQTLARSSHPTAPTAAEGATREARRRAAHTFLSSKWSHAQEHLPCSLGLGSRRWRRAETWNAARRRIRAGTRVLPLRARARTDAPSLSSPKQFKRIPFFS